MNYCFCPVCDESKHRREFRKRGGGFNEVCISCRYKVYSKQYYHRTKLVGLRRLSEEEKRDREKRATEKALMSEYRTATRQNRTRIKALEANIKPTNATIKWLTKRRAIQQVWTDALNTLLDRLHKDKPVPTLREYMERIEQHADYHP